MDFGDAFWRALVGSDRRPAVDDTVTALGGTRGIADRLGISRRQAQRYVKAAREGREVKSSGFAAFGDLRRNSPDVRQAAMNSRRRSRMRNHGAHISWKGRGGVQTDPRPDIRDRVAEADLSADSLQRIEDAWSRGDDAAALEAFRNAMDEDYVAGFEVHSIDLLDFKRHRF